MKIIKGEERLSHFPGGIIFHFVAVDQLKKNIVSCAAVSVLTDIQKMLARTKGLPDAGGQVILLRPGQDEQLNFRMKPQILQLKSKDVFIVFDHHSETATILHKNDQILKSIDS